MKDSIVLGWVDKAKRPNMKLQEWILSKQQEYGFDPKDLETNSEKNCIPSKKYLFIAEWEEIISFYWSRGHIASRKTWAKVSYVYQVIITMQSKRAPWLH